MLEWSIKLLVVSVGIIAGSATLAQEPPPTLRIYVLPEKEACGHAYGSPCAEWTQDRIAWLRKNNEELLTQILPDDGTLKLKKFRLLDFLQNYADDVAGVDCEVNDEKSQLVRTKNPNLADRKSVIFLFDFPNDGIRRLKIVKTLKCGDSDGKPDLVYDKTSRLYHESAENLYWLYNITWEITISPSGNCRKIKAINANSTPLQGDPECSSSTVEQSLK